MAEGMRRTYEEPTGGYAPGEGVQPGEWYFSDVQNKITAVDIEEKTLITMTESIEQLSANFSKEVAGALLAEQGSNTLVENFNPEQIQDAGEVVVNRKSIENHKEIIKLSKEGLEVKQGYHSHYQELGHAFSLSAQDKFAFQELAKEGMQHQTLVYPSSKNGTFYRGYCTIPGSEAKSVNTKVGNIEGAVIRKDPQGKLHGFSGIEAELAIQAAEQGKNPLMTIENGLDDLGGVASDGTDSTGES